MAEDSVWARSVAFVGYHGRLGRPTTELVESVMRRGCRDVIYPAPNR